MQNLLSQSKELLARPLKEARRKLLIILNILYVLLVIVFLISEKLSTGNFVPDPSLYFIYVPAFLLNFFSAIYNIKVYFYKSEYSNNKMKGVNKFIYSNYERIDLFVGWISIIPIMIMSFCNLMGLGNPSNDSIFTDYALAHSLIIGAVIIIGRRGAVVWFLIVVGVLIWDVNRLGWNYQYNYLTPKETLKYEIALKNKASWSLKRKETLEINGLNPPIAGRYFNQWIVFIIVGFMAAYFFSGIAIDIFKIIPSVISNIENAIEDGNRMDVELEQKQKEVTKSAMRIVRYNEILEELNSEIEKLEYTDKKKLIKVINVMRKALGKETDWEHFQTNFDSIHSDFFKTLKQKYSGLSQNEMKHLAYIRLNLSSTEISKLMDVKMESLRTLRYRLKKKLGVNEDIELRDFVDNIELIHDQV